MPDICFIIYTMTLNIKEKVAAALQITNNPKAVIKAD